MSGATRCDEVLRLIDEALADVQRAAEKWDPHAELPSAPPRFDASLRTAADLVAGRQRPTAVSTAA